MCYISVSSLLTPQSELPCDKRVKASQASLHPLMEALQFFSSIGEEAQMFLGSRMISIDVEAGEEEITLSLLGIHWPLPMCPSLICPSTMLIIVKQYRQSMLRTCPFLDFLPPPPKDLSYAVRVRDQSASGCSREEWYRLWI